MLHAFLPRVLVLLFFFARGSSLCHLPASIFAQHARCHDGSSSGAWPAMPGLSGFRVMKLMFFSQERAQMMLWRNLQTRILFALAAFVLVFVASNGSALAAYPDRV